MSKEKKGKKNKRNKERDNGSDLEVENENDQPASEDEQGEDSKIKKKIYDKELAKHHTELVKLQEWIKNRGLKVVVVFEGRDAAGKGGVIKKITQPLNPRVCRVVALGTATEREKSQWYFQRYV